MTQYDAITGGVTLSRLETGGHTYDVRHEYAPASGRLIRTWTSTTETDYGYDEQGRLEHVYSAKSNGVTNGIYDHWNNVSQEPVFGGSLSPAVTYSYDVAGNLETVAKSNGVVSTYEYDALNRLDILTIKKGGSTLFSQDYVIRSDGQRDGVQEHHADGDDVTIDWDYDNLGRLTRESYDSTDHNSQDFVANYTFDLNGNRLSKTQTGFGQTAITYDYNDRAEDKGSGVIETTPDPLSASGHSKQFYGSNVQSEVNEYWMNVIRDMEMKGR